MDYKALINKIIALISSPGNAWKKIVKEGLDKRVIATFVYPLIGLSSLSEFIGVFIGKTLSPDLFQVALTRSCCIAVSFFGGFFVAVSLLDKIGEKLYKQKNTRAELQNFVGYSMVVTFVLSIVSGLFSIAILHWILQVYTLFIVFEGGRHVIGMKEEQLTSYTMVATIVILLAPALIEILFNMLSVTLN